MGMAIRKPEPDNAAGNDNEGLIEIHVPSDQWGKRSEAYLFSREEIASPEAWLASERGDAAMRRIADGHYYTGYERSSEGLGLKDATKMADRILDAIAKGESPHWVIDPGHRCHQSVSMYLLYAEDDRKDLIEAIGEETEALGIAFDEDAWREALESDLEERLIEEDKSSAADMLSSHDVAEIAFTFCGGFKYTEDSMVSARGNTSNFGEMCIDEALQVNLSGVGYSIADYRKMTGDRNEGDRLRRGLRKRRVPLLTPGQLASLIDNACTSWFSIGLYAMVPVRDLLDLDPTKPLTFSRATVCSYNSGPGTFHEETQVHDVTVVPRHGRLHAITGYGPSEVCGGLSASRYEARLENAPRKRVRAAP